ncbi:MAG: isoaspartyl peptidase/L-asparaginase [Parvularculaceae bacterium]|nr:isoaspartyl peptidase/L-asparaginase [Parvularculaceae bacterium]
MLKLIVALGAAAVLAAPANAAAPITIVIHGGAGALSKNKYTPAEEAAYRATLKQALDAGYGVLDKGGSSLDAVTTAIVILEDSPLFNAGKGAVFTRDGKNELDASLMDGKDLRAGAVVGVTRVKNPILLARAVMEKSEHVMMAREGAEAFAKEKGVALVDPAYFRTERRWKEYQDRLNEEKAKKGAGLEPDAKHGTVGVVALDRAGNLAAGTSTGGMTLKRWGRVGDSPIIGAGTYADNRSCAVSATGWGEYFIRLTVARTICAEVEFGGAPLAAAADDVIMKRLPALGGDGGVVALDAKGNIAAPFNSEGMFRGVRRQGEKAKVAIWREEMKE